jgi:hypothetical protein
VGDTRAVVEPVGEGGEGGAALLPAEEQALMRNVAAIPSAATRTRDRTRRR